MSGSTRNALTIPAAKVDAAASTAARSAPSHRLIELRRRATATRRLEATSIRAVLVHGDARGGEGSLDLLVRLEIAVDVIRPQIEAAGV